MSYDNRRGKDDRKHIGDREGHYRDVSVNPLVADFLADNILALQGSVQVGSEPA